MRIGQLPPEEFRTLLAGQGARVKTGPFNIRIQTRLPLLAGQLHQLYALHTLVEEDEIANFMCRFSRGVRSDDRFPD